MKILALGVPILGQNVSLAIKNMRDELLSNYHCAKRLLRSSGPPGASVRPSVAASVRPHRSAKSTKNGPPETDLANSIAGRGVPLVHFWDLTQKRQLAQSDSIILILYVDDKKKPKSAQRFAPPALRVLSSFNPQI